MIAGMLAGAAGIVIVTRLPVLPGLLPVGGAVLLALVLACWCRPLPRLAACLVLGLAWGCLLYTSPSPRDRTRSRMPSSA